MSIRTTAEVVVNVTAVCDNPECKTIHTASSNDKLPGLVIRSATLIWKGDEVNVGELYVCKSDCTAKTLERAAEREINTYW